MKDQVIVITGASRGIGQATALRLARAGAQIVAVARSADGLAETRSLIESEVNFSAFTRSNCSSGKEGFISTSDSNSKS